MENLHSTDSTVTPARNITTGINASLYAEFVSVETYQEKERERSSLCFGEGLGFMYICLFFAWSKASRDLSQIKVQLCLPAPTSTCPVPHRTINSEQKIIKQPVLYLLSSTRQRSLSKSDVPHGVGSQRNSQSNRREIITQIFLGPPASAEPLRRPSIHPRPACFSTGL